MSSTVQVRAYDLTPGNVIVWPGGLRQTVARVQRETVLKRHTVYVVDFAENESTAAPARFSQDDVFDVERVN